WLRNKVVRAGAVLVTAAARSSSSVGITPGSTTTDSSASSSSTEFIANSTLRRTRTPAPRSVQAAVAVTGGTRRLLGRHGDLAGDDLGLERVEARVRLGGRQRPVAGVV